MARIPKGKCSECGGWHATSNIIHLSYVGHAALTNRLLEVDPEWSWEPLAMGEGLPVMDNLGGMWIRLTVCGVTRLGYGHAGDKSGGDAIKEVIGDAIRNAAMRFGAALDLWSKSGSPFYEPEEPKEPEKTWQDEAGKPFDWTRFNAQQAAKVRAVAQEAIQYFNEGREYAAYEEYATLRDKASTSEARNDIIQALWEIWKPHSALRASIKAQEAKERSAEQLQEKA